MLSGNECDEIGCAYQSSLYLYWNIHIPDNGTLVFFLDLLFSFILELLFSALIVASPKNFLVEYLISRCCTRSSFVITLKPQILQSKLDVFISSSLPESCLQLSDVSFVVHFVIAMSFDFFGGSWKILNFWPSSRSPLFISYLSYKFL